MGKISFEIVNKEVKADKINRIDRNFKGIIVLFKSHHKVMGPDGLHLAHIALKQCLSKIILNIPGPDLTYQNSSWEANFFEAVKTTFRPHFIVAQGRA